MTVKDVSNLTGVTVRTLHHYDEIGLLKPDQISPAGYRLYNDEDLEMLQQILLFRELGFALKDISGIVNRTDFQKREALERHGHMLKLKKKRIDTLIKLIDKILKGENTMSFKEFDMSEIKNHKKMYEKETIEKYGNTDAYKQSVKKTSKYSAKDWEEIKKDADNIYGQFSELMEKNAQKEENNLVAKKWQQHITKYYYDCSDQIMLGLADVYVNDPRFAKNIDKYKEGLAEYMSRAIKVCFE